MAIVMSGAHSLPQKRQPSLQSLEDQEGYSRQVSRALKYPVELIEFNTQFSDRDRAFLLSETPAHFSIISLKWHSIL